MSETQDAESQIPPSQESAETTVSHRAEELKVFLSSALLVMSAWSTVDLAANAYTKGVLMGRDNLQQEMSSMLNKINTWGENPEESLEIDSMLEKSQDFKNDYEEYQLNVTEDNELKPSKALKDDESDNCFKVAQAECPDIEYFDTLDDAKRYCDRHLIDYGHIMLCDSDKNEIGDWGDYE